MNFYEMWQTIKPTKVVGQADPTTISRAWERQAPHNPAQNQVYLHEVWRMTKAISNNESNRAWKELVLKLKRSIPDIPVYENQLNNLIKIQEIQGDATGAISFENPTFQCELRKNSLLADLGFGNQLHVKIAPPPLQYDNNDRALLSSIIIHELRHAMDFHEMKDVENPSYTQDKGTHFEINMDDYARNILEARAHADQVKNLIATLGGGEKARHVLKETTLGKGLVPELRDSMIELIDLLCGTNENIEPPAIVIKAEKHEADQATYLIQKICESFKFSRFIKNP